MHIRRTSPVVARTHIRCQALHRPRNSWHCGSVPEQTTVRGVPAAWFEDRHRLEIQTGVSTVVVFGHSPQFVLDLANALRGTNNGLEAGSALPAPDPRALDGSLPCNQ